MTRTPVPPFTYEDAITKVRMAENAWNMKDPATCAQAYTADSKWRNRSEFINGRAEIEAFLSRKWAKELDYRLIKEIWSHTHDRIAVRFVYEWQDGNGNWYRSHGNENWKFDADGYMSERHASINDVAISKNERLFLWPDGIRPEDHPGLSELNL